MIIVSSTAVETFNLAVSLVGTDGTVWDLVGGPVKVGTGLAGIGTPDPEHWWRDAPSLDGSYHLGQRTPRGDVLVPVRVSGTDPSDWLVNQKAFAASINSGDLCQLVITAPDQPARTLNVRLVSGLNGAYDVDPLLVRSAQYTLEFAADYPYWTTDPVSVTWTGTTSQSQAVVGDVAVWPKWTCTGPFTTFNISAYSSEHLDVASLFSQVALTGTATASQYRVIQTDPRANVIAVRDQSGSSAWGEVTARTFAPIAPGVLYVVITFTGTGSSAATTQLEFTPAYRQAW